MTGASATDRLWVTAVVLDAVALAGLFLIGLGSYLGFGPGLLISLLGALLGLSIVPAIVVSCVGMARLLRRRGVRRPAIAAVLTASVLAAAAAAPVVASVFSGLTPNPAADRLQPVIDQIQEAGGVELCHNGDPGLGPDNTRPWKSVYYRVPNRPGFEQQLRQVAHDHRLTSSSDYSGMQFNLVVTDRPVALNCSGGAYGRRYTAEDSYTTVAVDLQLPSRS